MSDSDDAVIERSRALGVQAKALVESSRLTRQAAQAAQQHARAVMATVTSAARARHSQARPVAPASEPLWNRRAMTRRAHERLARPGRRQADRRPAAAEQRRVLLVGSDEAWRLLSAYAFEEAGYIVFAAADPVQALPFCTRLLPDVIVVQLETDDALALLEGLSQGFSTSDIPVVVLSAALDSSDARRTLAAGAVTLLAHPGDVEVLVGEVDTLVAVGPRAQRALKRRLLDLQELARYYQPDAEGQAALRHLIDRLQVAVFAVDQQGHCVAASHGATALTGYSHGQLLHTSVFQSGFAGGRVSGEQWQDFLSVRQFAGTTTITNRAGDDMTVHAAAVAEILPGLHLAAFAAA